MGDGRTASPENLTLGTVMMANSPDALHSYLGNKFEAAMRHKLPQMEVRYQNLSITDSVVVIGVVTAKSELPAICNTIKRSLARFAWNKRLGNEETIKNVSGVLKPGTITLLLSQPGSGKTSFLREIRKRLPQFSAYVRQFDKHFPILTVQGTLDAVCGRGMWKHKEEMLSHGTPEQNAEALEVARSYFMNFPDLAIEQLGLQTHEDTILGNNMLGGESGGGGSEIIYHGPRNQAVSYFETLSFKCPPRRDAADFQLDLGTDMQEKYQVELPAGMSKHQRLASEFSAYCSALFTIICYPSVNFTNVASGFMYWVTISLFVLVQTYMGQLFIYALPSVEVATIVGVLYNNICLMFSGFNPPVANIPQGYHWLHLITPQKYAMGIMNAQISTDCPGGRNDLLACHDVADVPSTVVHITVKEFVEQNFGYKHSDIWSNFGYIFVFIAVYSRTGTTSVALYHQKR
ncbi:hypothetical protein BBO99_00005358 [Phytophthora kernoviae]|uniref:ABC transporter domain-containing protein n=1 Tax=Phytophthora kernoviae TaxID=325452 RepID=A0A3R7HI05_9STRA|nr:hypothetical protein BBI17_005407 [Phytophthora kernoviae]RLN79311.1 hypothetical protein BBO99_00005358 [Phytophthora kernoviae]